MNVETSDTFLGGRVRAKQPAKGFRSGLDAVMLAAAVPARPGEHALELGAGAGTASLCLAARVAGLDITGIEIDSALTILANHNAAETGVGKRVRFVTADIFSLPPEYRRDFDHVFLNPPFHGPGEAPPDAARARALQDDGRLADWLKLGLQRTVSGGYLSVILRADRMGEALSALPPGGITAFPLWPRAGEAAKRVILQVRKRSAAPFLLAPGLVLHEESGAYTPAAEAVLRRGEALALQGGAL